MTDEELLGHVRRHTGDDPQSPRLACPRAHLPAAELGVAVSRIGVLCRTYGIKITDCELGCFGGRRRGAPGVGGAD